MSTAAMQVEGSQWTWARRPPSNPVTQHSPTFPPIAKHHIHLPRTVSDGNLVLLKVMFPQIDKLLEVFDTDDLGVRCEVVEHRSDWGVVSGRAWVRF